jgi:hypothetical protein
VIFGAPVKRASTRAKVPPVQLDGSAPKTVPTASPRGGVGSRHGVEPAGRNEHMNHIDEPRNKLSAAEPLKLRRRPKSPSPEKSSWDGQWTDGVCVGDMLGSDARESGEACHGE